MTIQKKPAPGEELLICLDTLVTVRLPASAGEDRISVIEHRMPYGSKTPMHIHRNEDEVFHVLEGTMRFRIEGEDTVAHAGQIVMVPKGAMHAFRVESVAGARCLTITTRGDFERMLREMARPARSAELMPYVEPSLQVQQALAMACGRNGIDIVGPPIA